MKTQIIVAWVIILIACFAYFRQSTQEGYQPIPPVVCGIDPNSAFLQGLRQNLRQMENVRPGQIGDQMQRERQGIDQSQFSLYGDRDSRGALLQGDQSLTAPDWERPLFDRDGAPPQFGLGPQQNWANQFQPQLGPSPQQNWANQFQPQQNWASSSQPQNWANQFQPQLGPSPQQNWANQFQPQQNWASSSQPQNWANQFQPQMGPGPQPVNFDRYWSQRQAQRPQTNQYLPPLPMMPVYNRQPQVQQQVPVVLQPVPVVQEQVPIVQEQGLEQSILERQQQGFPVSDFKVFIEPEEEPILTESEKASIMQKINSYNERIRNEAESERLAREYEAEMEAAFAQMDLEEAKLLETQAESERLAREYEAEMEAAFAKMDLDDNLDQLNRMAESVMNTLESELTAEQRFDLEQIIYYGDFSSVSDIQKEIQKISSYEGQAKSRQQERKQKAEQVRREAEQSIIEELSRIDFGSSRLGQLLDDLDLTNRDSTLAELKKSLDVYPEEIDPYLSLDGDTVYQALVRSSGEELVREMVNQGEDTTVLESVLQNAGYTGITSQDIMRIREARQQEDRRKDQEARERAERAQAERQQREREAEQDIVDRLTSYNDIAMTMGPYTASRLQGAISKYEQEIGRPVSSINDVRQALEGLDYGTFFDELFTELVADPFREYLNAEERRIVENVKAEIRERQSEYKERMEQRRTEAKERLDQEKREKAAQKERETNPAQQEARRGLVNLLTNYDLISQIMGDENAEMIREAIDEFEQDTGRPVRSVEEIESALEGIEDDDYATFFDRVFLEVVVNSGDFLNAEQLAIIDDYSFAINNREEAIPINQFLRENQDLVQENRERVARERAEANQRAAQRQQERLAQMEKMRQEEALRQQQERERADREAEARRVLKERERIAVEQQQKQAEAREREIVKGILNMQTGYDMFGIENTPKLDDFLARRLNEVPENASLQEIYSNHFGDVYATDIDPNRELENFADSNETLFTQLRNRAEDDYDRDMERLRTPQGIQSMINEASRMITFGQRRGEQIVNRLREAGVNVSELERQKARQIARRIEREAEQNIVSKITDENQLRAYLDDDTADEIIDALAYKRSPSLDRLEELLSDMPDSTGEYANLFDRLFSKIILNSGAYRVEKEKEIMDRYAAEIRQRQNKLRAAQQPAPMTPFEQSVFRKLDRDLGDRDSLDAGYGDEQFKDILERLFSQNKDLPSLIAAASNIRVEGFPVTYAEFILKDYLADDYKFASREEKANYQELLNKYSQYL
jgi:hypothetical protein